MARIINELRIVNAKLGTKNNINSPAIYYAAKDGFDGYSMISVSSLPSAELFIGQGTSYQDDITKWTLFNSQAQYGGIGANAFARFQNLESVTIWQEDTDSLLLIDDNAFYSNVELAHIYVHPDLLAQYQTTYSGKSFVSLFEAYELITDLVVPTSFNSEIAPTTLTKAWLDTVTANMPLIEKNAKTTIIVPDYFTGIDSNAFSGLGSSFTYLNEIKCNGAKSFNAGFLNGASWCIHLWLDNGSSTFSGAYVTDDTTVLNANFRTLAPYLVYANYFMSEYPSEYPVVGYNQFSSGASLPQQSPTGEYLWFSNIDFDSDYDSPTGLENDDSYVSSYVASASGYYYCYGKTEILIIQDDGTHVLTSSLAQSSINGLDTPLSWITKVVMPNTFTSIEENCFNDDNIGQLVNVGEIDINISNVTSFGGNEQEVYRIFNLTNIINKLTIRTSNSRNVKFIRLFKFYHLETYGVLNCGVTDYGSNENFTFTITWSSTEYHKFKSVILGEGAYNFRGIWGGGDTQHGLDDCELLELPSTITTQNGKIFSSLGRNTSYGCKVYIKKSTSISMDSDKSWFKGGRIFNIYVPHTALTGYMQDTTWSNYSNKMVGFLDYTDTVPTWTDYSATWYSDEDCTIEVLPENFVSGNRYYAKLLWANPTLTIEPKSGETTLTSAIVTREIAKASSNPSIVTKVIVPVDFTAYDSGTITAIQNAFSNLRYLETTYSGGAMELDLQGDIVAKIVDIGKTLDEALVYARGRTTVSYNDSDVVIFPPIYIQGAFGVITNDSNLVYAYGYEQKSASGTWANLFRKCPNLLKVEKVTLDCNNRDVDFPNTFVAGCKIYDVTFKNIPESNYNYGISIASSNLEKLILNNFNRSITFSAVSQMTEQAFIEFFNSLGTPLTQQTITLKVTDYAKLSAETIAIATAKNWLLQQS